MFFSGQREEKIKRLHHQMVDRLRREGYLKEQELEQAFKKVPRHLFIPDESPKKAYQSRAVNLIPGVSSISQPQVVAVMLEGLSLKPGMKVLEVGTASGYNAALMAEIVSQPALVYTMEYVEKMVEKARSNLKEAGYQDVNLIQGDGSLGYPPGAPFDRIIITASSYQLPPPLIDQLADPGRLVLPYNFYDLISLLLSLKVVEGEMKIDIFGFPVVFVPLQGRSGEPEADLSNYKGDIYHYSSAKGIELQGKEGIGLMLTFISEHQQNELQSSRQTIRRWEEAGRPKRDDFSLCLDQGRVLVKAEY